MKRLILLAVLGVSFVSISGQSAQADGPAFARAGMRSQSGQQGVVARLIELERRKNAALRRMFSGR